MKQLVSLLEKIKPHFKIVLIYITEAHADDTWPLGFGINQPQNEKSRWSNCDSFMQNYPELKENVDNIFIDNLANDFIYRSGAFPEAYFITDKDGIVQDKWTVIKGKT